MVVALKYRRWAMRLSQVDLAAILGVSVSTLAAWEQGRRTPTLEHVEMWARALKLELGLTDPPGADSFEPAYIPYRVRKTLTELAA